ncbi:hypothetical protein GCM10023144_16140 [Pigmentiphaga soli]|uniref:Sel1 repeat family protein n=1 Tax=Pigmentiphaga soli TaxID=1007095 RepID=A0ABP8GSR7_9BURK
MSTVFRNRKTACRPAWLLAAALFLPGAAPAQAAQGTASASASARAEQGGGATPEQLYQLALEARTVRDYPAMLSFLRRAAGAGEPEAQELLAGVLLAGPALYGRGLRADPCEAAHWAERAAEQGSPVGRHYALVLNGMRDLPQGRAACASNH